MKIAIFIQSLHCGGSERVVSHLANSWAGMGHHVTVITLADIKSDIYALHPAVHRIELNLAADSHDVIDAVSINVHRVTALRQTLQQLDVDLVVGMMLGASILVVLASIGLKCRTVISERCYPPLIPVGRLWSLSRRLMYPWADYVVAQTQESNHWLRKHAGCKKVAVIPNPVVLPLNMGGRVLPPETVLKPGRRLLLAAGRLCGVKGFDLLLEAFSRIRSSCPQWDLVILGEGQDRDALQLQIDQAGLKNRIFLPGLAGNMTDWYKRADLFVLSSHSEGFPNVLIEAMASGCAAVSYDCDAGPRDIITDGVNGILVKPVADIGALAKALSVLMTDDVTRKRMAQNAIVVQERFSLPQILSLWERMINQ